MRREATGEGLIAFLTTMRVMRDKCAWKAAQTHESLVPFLTEEAEEVVEAIHEHDPQHLREELGDLLLQIYFHAAIAEEAGEFTIDDVVHDLTEKMVRRNPHVFGDAHAETIEEVEALWQAAKRAEKSTM